MYIPLRRVKDANVEGRDLPAMAKETMAPFKALMTKLLNVSPDELKK
jgi:hypothetical protein